MATVGGVAGSVPATPQTEPIGKPPLPRRCADFARRNEESGLARRGLGRRGAAAGRAGLRRHGPGRQGLAGHPGQRLVLPLRAQLDLRQRLRRRRAHRRRGPPQGAQFGAWAIIWGTIVVLAHRHRDRPPALHRRRLRPDRADARLDLAAARASPSRSWPASRASSSACGASSPSAPGWPSTSTRSSPTTCPTCPVLRYFRNPVGSRRGPARRPASCWPS